MTSEANRKVGAAARLYQKSSQARNEYGIICLTLQKKRGGGGASPPGSDAYAAYNILAICGQPYNTKNIFVYI